MAPSSPTDAATRKPSHLNVITTIHKKESYVRPHIHARLPSVESSDLEQSAPSSPSESNIDALDENSVELPEDICGLEQWDFEEEGWIADQCTAAEETAPASDIQLRENVWNENEAGGCERTDKISFLIHFLEDNEAPFSDSDSDFEDDSVGIWWAPAGCSV
jgi:hypothetical protein